MSLSAMKKVCKCLPSSHQNICDSCITKLISWLYWNVLRGYRNVHCKEEKARSHTKSRTEKKRMHILEAKPCGPNDMMHHSDVKFEEEFMNTSVPAASVGLSEDAMNAIATLWEAMYPVCYLHNTISICMSRSKILRMVRQLQGRWI